MGETKPSRRATGARAAGPPRAPAAGGAGRGGPARWGGAAFGGRAVAATARRRGRAAGGRSPKESPCRQNSRSAEKSGSISSSFARHRCSSAARPSCGVDQGVPEARVVVVVASRLGGGCRFLEPPGHEVDVALPPAVVLGIGRIEPHARSTSSTPRGAVWPPIGRSTAPSSDISLTSRGAMSATRCTSAHQRRISLA